MLEAPQGLADAMSDHFNPEAARAPAPRGFWIRENLFKYHAACYLTHSTIELARDLAVDAAVTPDQVAALTLSVDPGHYKVCHILEPETGLQTKFSMRHTAALGLASEDTARIDTYSDANAGAICGAATRPVTDNGGPFTMAGAVLETTDGRRFEKKFDVGVPAEDRSAGRSAARQVRQPVAPSLGDATSAALADFIR